MSKVIRFSAHKFDWQGDIAFSPEEYSKFKFGCKDAARNFGTDLAKKFIASTHFGIITRLSKTKNKRIIVLSSPYVHIPTATFALKDYFVREFNSALIEADTMPVLEAKIYRKSSYKEEYGEMSKEERLRVMENDTFYVDANLLKDNICIFLDDIVITGAHEHRIMKMLSAYGLDTSPDNYFLYFAELTNPRTSPKIENYLNYYFVKDLVSLDKIIKNEPFLMNTRVVKYILNAPHEEAKTFFNYQKYSFLHTLYHQAIGNGYHQIEDYKTNLFYLKSML